MKQTLKNINFLKIAEVILAVLLVLAPVAISAQTTLSQTLPCGSLNGVNCQTTSFNGLIREVINWMLGIAFGIAVLFLIIGGFWYITSAGNAETAEKGQQTAINAVIGIVIIILSYVIINVVAGLVTNPNSTSAP